MYPKAKVYSDGGHYIAIPHTEQPYRARRKPKEEFIEVPNKPKSNDNNCASSAIGESDSRATAESIRTKAAEETEVKPSGNAELRKSSCLTKRTKRITRTENRCEERC